MVSAYVFAVFAVYLFMNLSDIYNKGRYIYILIIGRYIGIGCRLLPNIGIGLDP